MQKKFKVGDRVKYLKGEYAPKGSMGTIKSAEPGGDAVEFDEDVGGHDCMGTCKDNHGWYISSKDLELISSKGSEMDILKARKESKSSHVPLSQDVGDALKVLLDSGVDLQGASKVLNVSTSALSMIQKAGFDVEEYRKAKREKDKARRKSSKRAVKRVSKKVSKDMEVVVSILEEMNAKLDLLMEREGGTE